MVECIANIMITIPQIVILKYFSIKLAFFLTVSVHTQEYLITPVFSVDKDKASICPAHRILLMSQPVCFKIA